MKRLRNQMNDERLRSFAMFIGIECKIKDSKIKVEVDCLMNS